MFRSWCYRATMDDLFADSDFAWSIRMRREEPGAFFARQDATGSLLSRRNHWLDETPERCLSTSPLMDAITEDLWDLALSWYQVEKNGERTLENLSRQWEADLILLDTETFRVAGGCVCFPSSWNLQEATGKTLSEVHAVVPGLSDELGPKIERFLRKLPPGQTFLRENWGMTRSGHLNYHPALERARLDESVTLSEAFLRIEHQAFLRLPTAVLLGVRIEPVSLANLIVRHPETAARLRRQLETMPDEVAHYKSLEAGIPKITELLREA